MSVWLHKKIDDNISVKARMFFFTWFLIQITFISITGISYPCSSNLTCGCSLKSAVVTKIIGGEAATIDSWGWAVSIRSGNSHTCGGSLISPNVVISAAHCFVSIGAISTLSVTAGSTYWRSIKQQRSISEIFIHRYYNSKTFVNDIAVLHLSSPFDMTDHSLALICPSTRIIENESNNTNVVAIGWGVLTPNSNVPWNTLQQVTLKTIENTARSCQQLIRDEKVQFCAGDLKGGKGKLLKIKY
jgi:transmembrane serine protease 4